MAFAMGEISTPIVELPVKDKGQTVEWIEKTDG